MSWLFVCGAQFLLQARLLSCGFTPVLNAILLALSRVASIWYRRKRMSHLEVNPLHSSAPRKIKANATRLQSLIQAIIAPGMWNDRF
jgi:hypothetical protein